MAGDALSRQVDTDILLEKEQTIQEYKETVQVWSWARAQMGKGSAALLCTLQCGDLAFSHVVRCGHVGPACVVPVPTQILELKIRKLDQLVRIKDSRIQTLTARVQQLEQKLGLAPPA